MTAGSTADWLRRVPKVELHLHLEGAIPHAALWDLVQKYGGDPTVPDFERGLLVTINTDDPKMFGNSLVQEFQALVDVHGFRRDEIRTLILSAVRASWLPAERRQHLAVDLQDDPDWR